MGLPAAFQRLMRSDTLPLAETETEESDDDEKKLKPVSTFAVLGQTNSIIKLDCVLYK